MNHHRQHDDQAPQDASRAATERVAYGPGTVVRSVMETTTDNAEKRSPWYHEPWGLVWICAGYVLMDFISRMYAAFNGTLVPRMW